jgi:GNAT superfamily N-acetyltransferase
MPPAGALVALHVALLYRLDAQGRLTQTNEAEPRPAPRVFVARSDAGVVVHVRDDLEPASAAEVARRARELPRYPHARGDVELYAPIEAAVGATGPVASRWHGLACRFTAAAPAPARADREPSDVVEIAEDRTALAGPFARFASHLDEIRPFFAVVRDGVVVSACYSARLSRAGAEAGVDTLPAFRRRGYAAAVVDAWRAAIERSGRTPLFSTSYDNESSRALADRLGLVQYAETFSLR